MDGPGVRPMLGARTAEPRAGESFVERRVVVVDLQPAEPLLDLSCSPGRRDTGALQGQQDRQAPAQEMVPAGSVDRADDLHVGVALASPHRPAPVCRRRVARFHQVGEVLGADEVLEEAGGLVPGFALPAPRGTGQDPVAGLAAVSAPGPAAAAAEGDGVSRATAGLADFGAERPGSGDDPPNALGRAVGGLANRLEQQPSVGGPTSETVPSRWASRTVAVMSRRQPVIGSLYPPSLSFAGPSPVRPPR